MPEIDVFANVRQQRLAEPVMKVAPEGPGPDGLYQWRVETKFCFPPEYRPYLLTWRFRLPRPGELYVDKWVKHKERKLRPGMRVLCLVEPNDVGLTRWRTIRQQFQYDTILTHDPWVLALCHNAVLFPFGTAWVTQPPAEKVFAVSAVIGRKAITPLHLMRHRLWHQRERFTVPMRLFLSGDRNPLPMPEGYPWILGPDKAPVFETQFHIAMENQVVKNYFSEKLVDCFMTRTVPIYLGCPNIARFFNPAGILHARTEADIYRLANRLTPETYASMREAIDDNQQRAAKWVNLEERLAEQLKDLCVRKS